MSLSVLRPTIRRCLQQHYSLRGVACNSGMLNELGSAVRWQCSSLSPHLNNQSVNRNRCLQPISNSFIKYMSTTTSTDTKPVAQTEPEVKTKPFDPTSEEERKKRANTFKKSNKYMGYFTAVVVGGWLVYAIMVYGPPERHIDGSPVIDEYSEMFPPVAYCQRVLRRLRYLTAVVSEPSRQKLLPEPLQPPYHQPKYTLCIEMDHILVNPEWKYETGWRYRKRNALEYFLRQVGYPNFELVIYTKEDGFTVDSVVSSMEDQNMPVIAYRLYKDCNENSAGIVRKRLDLLNRDLRHVIHVDWDPAAIGSCHDNVLLVPKWTAKDPQETALLDLAELLKVILQSDADDIRPIIEYYNKFDDPAKEFRNRSTVLRESHAQEQHQKEQAASNKGLVSNYTGRLFGFGRHS